MTKPSTLLKVMSIIFIIFGIIMLILGGISLVTGIATLMLGIGIFLMAAAVLSLIDGLLYLLCGIFGVGGRNLRACFIMSIIILIAQIISIVMNIIGGAFNPISIVGIVLTILYILGVKQTQAVQA